MKQADEIKSLKLVVAVYIVVFALKLAVYFASGVMALFAEALHTLSDIFVSGFLLVATIWSRKTADETHMFGYGRAQNVAALVAATLFISFTSFELYREAIPRLFAPPESEYKNLPLVIAVLLLSMGIVAAPLVNLMRQKNAGAAARAQRAELINDELGLAAALVGTLFIIWGQPLADPLAAIAVATIIAYKGVQLFYENLCVLVGKSPGPDFMAALAQRARSVPGVLGVHDLRAEHIAPDVVHAAMHIVVARGLPIEEANRISEQVHDKVHSDLLPGYCVIHVDPSEPEETASSQTGSPEKDLIHA